MLLTQLLVEVVEWSRTRLDNADSIYCVAFAYDNARALLLIVEIKTRSPGKLVLF